MVKADQLLESFNRDLADLLPDGWRASLRAQQTGEREDARLTFSGPDGVTVVFSVEAKSRLEPSQVVLRTERRPLLVIAPVIGPRTREILNRMSTSWCEPGGDCRIASGPLLIVRERASKPLFRNTNSAEVTRFVKRPFTGSALKIVRRLLIEPERTWSVTNLSSATDVSIGFVSRVLATLERDAYVVRNRGETRLKDFDDLLDAWVQSPQATEMTVEGVSLKKPGEVLQTIADLGRSGYALTAEAAAEQLAPFARFNRVELYVKDFGPWQKALRLTPVPVGANVRLIKSEDMGVFDGTLSRRGFEIVSLPQLYVDLMRRQGAGAEAAAFLRQRFDKLRRELGPGRVG
jgi:hypothetical protein